MAGLENSLKRLYHYYVPNKIKIMHRRKLYGRGIDWGDIYAPDKQQELEFIRHNRILQTIPYDWTMKYHAGRYKIHRDERGYFCIPFRGEPEKKLYFPEECALDATASEIVNSLMIEQDFRSPHQYFSENVQICEGDVVFDVGTAEGLITLKYIDKIKRAYLFECDPKWIKVLKKTFEPWKDKVVIVNKYVSAYNDDTHTTLEPYINQHAKERILIKMDIEGMETEVIPDGIGNAFGSNNLKFSCCTYHKAEDADRLNHVFKDMGYSTEFSQGYTVWRDEPHFRKGIIRAWK